MTLDDADGIQFWLRLQNDDLTIVWEGGNYNPDFLAVDATGSSSRRWRRR